MNRDRRRLSSFRRRLAPFAVLTLLVACGSGPGTTTNGTGGAAAGGATAGSGGAGGASGRGGTGGTGAGGRAGAAGAGGTNGRAGAGDAGGAVGGAGHSAEEDGSADGATTADGATVPVCVTDPPQSVRNCSGPIVAHGIAACVYDCYFATILPVTLPCSFYGGAGLCVASCSDCP
jgi:hypothetical protein